MILPNIFGWIKLLCHTKKPADICLSITVKQDNRNCWNGGKGKWSYQDEIGKASRPTSVSFLIRTSGKENEVATWRPPWAWKIWEKYVTKTPLRPKFEVCWSLFLAKINSLKFFQPLESTLSTVILIVKLARLSGGRERRDRETSSSYLSYSFSETQILFNVIISFNDFHGIWVLGKMIMGLWGNERGRAREGGMAL